MTMFRSQQRHELEQLMEEYTERGLSRRAFMQRAMAIGLTASSATAVLTACGTPQTSNSGSGGNTTVQQSSTVDVLNVWGGTEQDSFRAVTDSFASSNKIKVNLETTRDLDAAITSRRSNPPDIAILPNPGKMQQLASQNRLVALDQFLDMGKINQDYAKSWVDLGSYNGKFYALFYKAANKGTVWYNPRQFQADGYKIPQTWTDTITLSDKIAQSGKYPWTMGVESGAASGWPATDWIAQIYLNQYGPEMYDKWVGHKIPWTDGSVKDAFKMFGQIVGGKHYINGAPQSILATGFQQATYAPYTSPPGAYMDYLGDFAAGFIQQQFPNAKPVNDFNFFPFPTINAQYKGALTVGADVVVAMKNTTAVQALVKYLATAGSQEIWVKRGGFTSPNKSVSLSAYPNEVAKASAQMLTSAPFLRFGAGDLMPPQVQQAFWHGMLTFIGDQSQLDSVLSSIESTAQQAYTTQ